MDTGNWDPQVLQSKTICTASVQGGKACPERAFDDIFKEDPASTTVALGYHIWHDGIFAPLRM
eukprot:1154830-Pelagomonas_calceolata.AAC.1